MTGDLLGVCKWWALDSKQSLQTIESVLQLPITSIQHSQSHFYLAQTQFEERGFLTCFNQDGSLFKTIMAHSDQITGVHLMQDRIITAGHDCQVKVFSVPELNSINSLKLPESQDKVTCLVVHAETTIIVFSELCHFYLLQGADLQILKKYPSKHIAHKLLSLSADTLITVS